MPTATATAHREYRYSQLGPKGKAAAREWWRDHCRGDDRGLDELLRSDLSDHFGITNCKLYYSLGCSQGDGTAFEGHPDLDEWAEHDETLAAMLLELKGWAALFGASDEPSPSAQIKHEGRYYHWNSMEVGVEFNVGELYVENETGRDKLDAMVNELQGYLNEAVKEISRALERIGYDEIESRESDEYIEEELLANEDNDYFRFNRRGEHVG